jgi:hypothetical protein
VIPNTPAVDPAFSQLGHGLALGRARNTRGEILAADGRSDEVLPGFYIQHTSVISYAV